MRRLVLVAFLGMTIGFAFAQSTGSIQIETNLPDAKVFIDGKLVGQTSAMLGRNILLIDVSSGTREVKISLDRYSDDIRDVVVKSGETLRIVHSFVASSVRTTSDASRVASQSKLATGTIHVTSKPIDLEMILDDGKARSKTKNSFLDVPVGKHRVTVRATASDALSIDFNLEEGQAITVTADFYSTPRRITIDAKYKLIIKTDIPAEVEIDNKSKGKTPVSLDLLYGDYDISVKAKGYETITQRISLSENRILDLSMKPLARSLNVDTIPSGAIVLIDGKAVGTSPIRGLPIEMGEIKIRAEKKDRVPYVSEEKRLSIAAEDAVTSIKLELTAKAATVKVEVDSGTYAPLRMTIGSEDLGDLSSIRSTLVPVGKQVVSIGKTSFQLEFREAATYSIRPRFRFPEPLPNLYTDPWSVPGALKPPPQPDYLDVPESKRMRLDSLGFSFDEAIGGILPGLLVGSAAVYLGFPDSGDQYIAEKAVVFCSGVAVTMGVVGLLFGSRFGTYTTYDDKASAANQRLREQYEAHYREVEYKNKGIMERINSERHVAYSKALEAVREKNVDRGYIVIKDLLSGKEVRVQEGATVDLGSTVM